MVRVFLFPLSHRMIREQLERGHLCLSVCSAISEADPYTLLAGYHDAQEQVDSMFKMSSSVAPVACDDLSVLYPHGVTEELTEQFDNYGTVKSGKRKY